MSNDSRKPKGSPGGTGGEYDRKRTGTAGLPPLTGRVDTLVPPLRLSDERKGKAPELRPGERPESAQGRFGRYLGANLEGDRAGAELDALRVLYGPQVSPPSISTIRTAATWARPPRPEGTRAPPTSWRP